MRIQAVYCHILIYHILCCLEVQNAYISKTVNKYLKVVKRINIYNATASGVKLIQVRNNTIQGSGIKRDFAFSIGGKWNPKKKIGVINNTAVNIAELGVYYTVIIKSA